MYHLQREFFVIHIKFLLQFYEKPLKVQSPLLRLSLRKQAPSQAHVVFGVLDIIWHEPEGLAIVSFSQVIAALAIQRFRLATPKKPLSSLVYLRENDHSLVKVFYRALDVLECHVKIIDCNPDACMQELRPGSFLIFRFLLSGNVRPVAGKYLEASF